MVPPVRVIAGLGLVGWLAWQTVGMAAEAPVSARGGGLTLQLSRATGRSAGGGLTVTEGPKAEPVVWAPARDWQIGPQAVSCVLADAQGLEVVQRLGSGRALGITLAFTNRGARQRLLEVSYAVPQSGQGLKWWDGMVEAPPRRPKLIGLSTTLRFPLSAVYDAGAGTAVGVDPHRLLSSFATGAEPCPGGLAPVFAARLVVDPGQTVTLPLYAFRFTPRYGHLDAVQRAYAIFPDMFSLTRGIRPLIIGGGGYLFSNADARHLQWEDARRYGMGWEWAYCPAQIAGDWYADERFYDPERGYAGNADRHVNTVKGSLDDYRRDMRERFHEGWPATVLGYYMLPHAADEVVLKAFPEAVISDGQGQKSRVLKGWIKTDATTRMTYPWGNAYGQEVVREIRQLAADFQPGAIAFDEAYGGDAHFGAGIEGDPGRSWSEEGVYASTQVALGHLGDAIHNTRVRQYTLATIFNKPHSYNTATRADVAMHEWPPYVNPDSYTCMRLLIGHKPMSWWHGAGVEDIVRWQELTPEQITEAVRGITDFMRLVSLRYGAFPMNLDAIGRKQLVQMMPVLSTMLREGWQPVPAAHADPELWLSRYGEGVRSFLCVGNPKREAHAAKLTVDNGYLGQGHFVFSDYEGKPLSVSSADGQSHLDLGRLPGHAHRIARAVLQVEPDRPTKLTGSATCTPAPLATGFVQAQFALTRRGSGRLTVDLPEGARPLALTINGKGHAFQTIGRAVTCRVPLGKQMTVRLDYRPRVVVGTGDLTGFPFVGEGDQTATIELPAQSTAEDSFTARRIAGYFEWYYRRQSDLVSPPWDLIKVGRVVKLPVVAAGQAPAGKPVVALIAQPEGASVVRRDMRLVVGGATPGDREAAMLRLLELLDKRYECYGGMPATPALVKAGLAGKTLE